MLSAATFALASGRLTRALNNGYEVLSEARTSYVARSRTWRALVSLLNAAAPVVDATITVATRHARAVEPGDRLSESDSRVDR